MIVKMGAVLLFRETSRRQLMFGVGTFAILAHATGAFAARSTANLRGKARPLPLGAVRLKPSDFATAVEVNRTYLHRLDPDRLLHNFRAYRSEEHTSELQSLMRISYAVFCLKKKKKHTHMTNISIHI